MCHLDEAAAALRIALPRLADLSVGLSEDWLWLDARIETLTAEIETIAAEPAA
jgi:hypothetical protein